MGQGHCRIAHLMPWPGIGGTEHATLRIMRAVENGFTHMAFCYSYAEAVETFFREAGIATATWSPEHPSLRHFRGFLYRSRELARHLRQARIDLIHAQDVDAVAFGGVAARLAGVPLVCHVRNRYPAVKPYVRPWLWTPRAFVFVSKQTWQSFGYRVRSSRGHVVYDGIDVPPDDASERDLIRAELIQQYRLPPAVKVVGMVARLEPQKDYGTLVEAAARLFPQDPSIRFLIVGGTSEREEYRRHHAEVCALVRARGLEEAFVFTGYRADAQRVMRAFDVFVLSTHYEGLPLVLLEAMAAGRPVVATAVDGIPELITDGQTGVLVGHGRADDLAAALGRLLRDPESARRLGNRAREFVMTEYSQERFARNMTSVYEGLLPAGACRG